MISISLFRPAACSLILAAALSHLASAADIVCLADHGVVAEGQNVTIRTFAVFETAVPVRAEFSASGGVIQRVPPTQPNVTAEARWAAPQSRGTFEATVKLTSGGESASCRVRLVVVGSDFGPSGTEAGRVWLRTGGREPAGFGAYTYLLFSAPAEATNGRQKQAVEALLKRISEMSEMQKQFEKQQLSLVSLPVKELPKKDSNADAVLAIYDYPRARKLLNTIDPALRVGPYLVTVPAPLESANSADRIVQDLSSAPPDVIEFWVGSYFDQLAQQSLWGRPFEPSVTLRLRTLAAVIGLAIPDVTSAYERVIKLLPGKK